MPHSSISSNSRRRNGVLSHVGSFVLGMMVMLAVTTTRHRCGGGDITNSASSMSSSATKPSKDHNTNNPHNLRYAIAGYIDNEEHVIGTFSLLTQLRRFHMSHIPYIAVVSQQLPSDSPAAWRALRAYKNVELRVVDRNILLHQLPDNQGLWPESFLKLWLFNLTTTEHGPDYFDKVLVLDQDVLVRRNLHHWFDYPTPAAVQDPVEWNTGAMVISPSRELFDDLWRRLPQQRAYQPQNLYLPTTNNNPGVDVDYMNSGMHDQGFLSAYFSRPDAAQRWHTLPSHYALLCPHFENQRQQYFARFRLELFETLHLTVCKPLRPGSRTTYPPLCQIYREYAASFKGIEQYGLTVNDFLKDCPNETTTTTNS